MLAFNSNNAIYAIQVYFDENLESKLIQARNLLKSHIMHTNLTMTLPEIHQTPCMTLFTTTNPRGRYDNNFTRTMCTTLNEFMKDDTTPRHNIPVTFDLESLFDVGDEKHMSLSPLDRLGDVKDFRGKICMAMENKGVTVKGNYMDKGWVPVVNVVKQTWEQYHRHRPQDEKCWEEFCKENNNVLIGFVDKIAMVKVYPTRILYKAFPMHEDGQDSKFCKSLH